MAYIGDHRIEDDRELQPEAPECVVCGRELILFERDEELCAECLLDWMRLCLGCRKPYRVKAAEGFCQTCNDKLEAASLPGEDKDVCPF